MASALISKNEVEARVLMGYLERLGQRLDAIRQATIEHRLPLIVKELKQIAVTARSQGVPSLAEAAASLAMEMESADALSLLKIEEFISFAEDLRRPALLPKTLGIQARGLMKP